MSTVAGNKCRGREPAARSANIVAPCIWLGVISQRNWTGKPHHVHRKSLR
jgi:hypothetical protein